ncbi:hypothetical protein [Alkaliflexus imshenetskii]|uniref:hypothetical protein n=1 Tax=Alkaliflexus imshenetskii TaxID=286730 RepID=UPI00047B2F17|nr:hypothetical protein [Alkaliflexus imshenetskii]
MNRQQFIEAVRHPELLNEQTLDLIRVTLDEYPFFQAGRMLWIKNLHLLDHIRYNNELKLAAAHISDRSKLYELLNPVLFKQSESDATVVIQEPESPQETIEPNSEVQDLSPQVFVTDSDDVDPPAAGADYFDVDDVFETDSGEKLDFSKYISDDEDEEEAEIKYAFPQTDENIVLPSADLLHYELNDHQVYSLKDAGEVRLDEARSFSDWLSVLRHQPVPAVKTDESVVPVKGKQKKKMALIDNFLERGINTRIKVSHDETAISKQEDISAKSLQESEDLMTETLANIYIRQKHFLKAIDIFERLRLKYPEKNTYFARRIKELEEQINNQ